MQKHKDKKKRKKKHKELGANPVSERGVGQSVFMIGEKDSHLLVGREAKGRGSSVRFCGGRTPVRFPERRTYFPFPKME